MSNPLKDQISDMTFQNGQENDMSPESCRKLVEGVSTALENFKVELENLNLELPEDLQELLQELDNCLDDGV